jgi:hypothetical protein
MFDPPPRYLQQQAQLPDLIHRYCLQGDGTSLARYVFALDGVGQSHLNFGRHLRHPSSLS